MSTSLPALSGPALHLAHRVSKDLGSAQHARVALALLIEPQLRGKRAIALASGLNERTVEGLVPWTEGEAVGFLVCTQQGTSGPEVDEPKKTGWALHLCDRNGLPQVEGSLSVEVLDQGEVLPGLDREAHARARTTGVVRSGSGLDPKLDVWADTRAGVGGCGTSGWTIALLALAGLLGTRNAEGQIEVGGRDAAAALGMTDRGVAKVFDRMQAASLGWRERGRFVLLPQMLDEGMQGQGRADRRRERHERETKAFHDVDAVRTKYERRELAARALEYDPTLTPAELDELWASEVRRREVSVEVMGAYLAAQEPLSEPEPVALPVPDPGADQAFSSILSRIRAA